MKLPDIKGRFLLYYYKFTNQSTNNTNNIGKSKFVNL